MTDGVRRLSHDEAEMLISARMDEQLDRADSRALLVHLQTCESCRAFAVQSEVLGRELCACRCCRQARWSIARFANRSSKGRSRWSLASLMPATAGNSGLRLAVGALAMLTLVSVFLLVRMAGDQTGEGPSIDAPNGGVAQQLDRTPTADSGLARRNGWSHRDGACRGATDTGGANRADIAAVRTDRVTGDRPRQPAAPTEALDRRPMSSRHAHSIPASSIRSTRPERRRPATPNQPKPRNPTEPDATEEPGDVSVAAVMVDDGTPAKKPRPPRRPNERRR